MSPSPHDTLSLNEGKIWLAARNASADLLNTVPAGLKKSRGDNVSRGKPTFADVP
jgi:hypothetical protein